MAQNAQALLYLLLLLAAWLLLPLLPAWITYRITPAQNLGLGGPLAQLTVRASGAFAAYLALVLVSYQLVATGGMSIVGAMATPSVWTFKADIVAIDESGRKVSIPDSVKELDVSFRPLMHDLGKSRLLVRLPYNPGQWPFMTVTIPGFGGAEIDLNRLQGVELDHFSKTVELDGPIPVRQARGGGLGVPFATASANP
jgi:hypothetical protein